MITRYAELTGRTPLPPRWALGYHQSRYSYETSREVLRIAREFRRRKLPCDALYLDIHHMDEYRVFTFGKGFPKPKSLIHSLAEQGFHTVAIVDPGVKNDPGFGVLRRGLALDAFVKQADGVTDQLGEVWPGESRFPDFLNPDVRRWWGAEQQTLLEAGNWYDFWSGTAISGQCHIIAEAPLGRMPLYIRGGAMVPAGPVRLHTREAAPSMVDLELWRGGEGRMTWWEADPRGGNLGEERHYSRLCSWTQKDQGHLLALAAPEGALKSNVQFWRPRIHGATRKPRVVCGGLEVPVRLVKSSGAYQFTVPNSPHPLEIEIQT